MDQKSKLVVVQIAKWRRLGRITVIPLWTVILLWSTSNMGTDYRGTVSKPTKADNVRLKLTMSSSRIWQYYHSLSLTEHMQ
jgi:hypothetical protein